MSNGPDFYKTRMGLRYYENTMPRIAVALERIAVAMEEANRLNKKPIEMVSLDGSSAKDGGVGDPTR